MSWLCQRVRSDIIAWKVTKMDYRCGNVMVETMEEGIKIFISHGDNKASKMTICKIEAKLVLVLLKEALSETMPPSDTTPEKKVRVALDKFCEEGKATVGLLDVMAETGLDGETVCRTMDELEPEGVVPTSECTTCEASICKGRGTGKCPSPTASIKDKDGD